MQTRWFPRLALVVLPLVLLVVLPAAAAGTTSSPLHPPMAAHLDAVGLRTAAVRTGRSPGEGACSGSQLRPRLTTGLPGAGHWSSVIVVRNSGPGRCLVRGYPKVEVLTSANGDGSDVAETPRGFTGGLPTGATPPRIVLHTGEVASAVMEGTDIPIGNATSCPTYSSFTIVLPGQHNVTTFHHSIGGCSGLTVHPFVLGFNGSYPTGEVAGRTRICTLRADGHPLGPQVQIDAWSGTHLAAAETIIPNAATASRYRLVLKPGEYRIGSAPDTPSRRVDVHAGRTVDVGSFGTCAPAGPIPTTTPGRSSPTTTTTTTDP